MELFSRRGCVDRADAVAVAVAKDRRVTSSLPKPWPGADPNVVEAKQEIAMFVFFLTMLMWLFARHVLVPPSDR